MSLVAARRFGERACPRLLQYYSRRSARRLRLSPRNTRPMSQTRRIGTLKFVDGDARSGDRAEGLPTTSILAVEPRRSSPGCEIRALESPRTDGRSVSISHSELDDGLRLHVPRPQGWTDGRSSTAKRARTGRCRLFSVVTDVGSPDPTKATLAGTCLSLPAIPATFRQKTISSKNLKPTQVWHACPHVVPLLPTKPAKREVHEGQGGNGIPTFSAPVTAPTVAAELAPST